jgi:sec-independent protein translocase protein TatB
MFDIAPSEMLLTAIVAIVVIGPKDMPLALRTAGRWLGKMRRMSSHLRTGFEAMIREAELEEMERKWREQNEAIMRANPAPSEALLFPPPAAAEAADAAPSAPAPAHSEPHQGPTAAEQAQPAAVQPPLS